MSRASLMKSSASPAVHRSPLSFGPLEEITPGQGARVQPHVLCSWSPRVFDWPSQRPGNKAAPISPCRQLEIACRFLLVMEKTRTERPANIAAKNSCVLYSILQDGIVTSSLLQILRFSKAPPPAGFLFLGHGNSFRIFTPGTAGNRSGQSKVCLNIVMTEQAQCNGSVFIIFSYTTMTNAPPSDAVV